MQGYNNKANPRIPGQVYVRCGYCGKVLPVLFPANDHMHRFALHVCRHGIKKQGFCPLSLAKQKELGLARS